MQVNNEWYKSVAQLIYGFLEEIEFADYSDLLTCSEIVRKLKKSKFSENGITSGQLGYEENNECVVFALYSRDKSVDELFAATMSKPLDPGNPLTVHIGIFATSVEELLEVQKKKDQIVKKVKSWLSKRKDGNKRSSVKFYVMHAPEKEKKSHTISINSRIRALHHVSENENGVKIGSDVYIVKLYDIVNLYSRVGAELFERNVRYHIRDILNVESEIQKTLRDTPSEFFNLNNGIAMQIKDIDKLDRRNERDIRVVYENKGDVSIINGAQTISAATEFFFQATGDDEYDKIKNTIIEEAKKNAYVLLRIFYPEEGNEKNCITAFEKISISLNRQKPINAMDVQYTCREVMTINGLYENSQGDPFYFRLLKRGQEAPGRFQYQLSEFGRIVTAYYCNEPGRARADSTQEIIRYNTSEENDETVVKNTIYAPFDTSSSDRTIFMQWYKPVNFAIELTKKYSEIDKKYRKIEIRNDNVQTVLSNGRYFFVAYVIRRLNGTLLPVESGQNFSKFPYKADDLKNQNLDSHIINFAEMVADFARLYLKDHKKNRTILNSNDFKTEELYVAWCDFAKDSLDVKKWDETLGRVLKND